LQGVLHVRSIDLFHFLNPEFLLVDFSRMVHVMMQRQETNTAV
jgi:hypothetical protein